MTPAILSPGVVRTAERLRTSAVGLSAVIGLVGAAASPTAPRGIARSLRRSARRARDLLPPQLGGPASTARSYGRAHGVPHARVPRANHPATLEALRRHGIDVVVAVGAGILRPLLLDAPDVVFVNAHAGRLPKYGGMNVVEWAVYNGDPVWGTIHRIAAGIDTGDILDDSRTVPELRARASAAVWDMLVPALDALARGARPFRPQAPAERRIQWFRITASFSEWSRRAWRTAPSARSRKRRSQRHRGTTGTLAFVKIRAPGSEGALHETGKQSDCNGPASVRRSRVRGAGSDGCGRG